MIVECLCPRNGMTLVCVVGCRIGLSFLTKVLVADVDPQLHEQAFESGQIPWTLFLASVWLIGVCIITMIYAAANGLHLPPAFGWLGACTLHDLSFLPPTTMPTRLARCILPRLKALGA